ncbi:MAG: DNA-binding protein WhiA [Coriobacteriales bacterium]|jgi:DNA-binding protein WhiA|nr:DNA-binding protein WhiA [Coriobacteriales bacterium]
MSFTAEIKDELSRLLPEHLPCRKAELSALVRIQGRLSGNYRLEVTTEIAPVARIVVRLLHGIYGLKTEITTRRSVLHRTYNYLITVPSQIGLEDAIRDMGILSSSGLEMGVDPDLVRKPCCTASYLRGAFLGGGFISNPQGDFHFELACGHEALANGLVALLARSEIPARSIRRRGAWIVYIKGAEPILDFLALVGAHRGMLAMENVRVTKSVRNDVNRRLNAEMANQAKSIDASMGQVKAIRLLVEHCGVESLPPALREFALLRLSHPDASLRELGELASPPLTKSAVYHRVRRIEAIARECLGSE